ncbi:MAG: excalibur calcium-binding domain-containing protein [Candidatus Competibacteraceae bacterium]
MESPRPRPVPQRKGTCAIASAPATRAPASPTAAPTAAPTSSAASGSGFTCAGKRRCGEMTSCEEAKFYLTLCGVRSLDGDKDGTPCEALCR